jgi:zinc/manganese transport system substrate-binding protein
MIILLLCLALPLWAERLHVVATYPYIAGLVEQVGQDRVQVSALAGGEWDPHTILPKPSYIGKLPQADLLIISGAQLEIGWLPPLMNQANNPKIAVGTKGLVDLSRSVELLDVPTSISRAQGDIHPDGNPHFYLDPLNMPHLAQTICDKLCELDMSNADFYKANTAEFIEKWNAKTKEWAEKMAGLRGVSVIEYHKNYDYFLNHFGIKLLGTVELLPGIPPSSKHIQELEAMMQAIPVRTIIQDVYNPDEASRHLAQKFNIPMIKLPHDVGAVPEAKDIFSLFDEMVRRLTHE